MLGGKSTGVIWASSIAISIRLPLLLELAGEQRLECFVREQRSKSVSAETMIVLHARLSQNERVLCGL